MTSALLLHQIFNTTSQVAIHAKGPPLEVVHYSEQGLVFVTSSKVAPGHLLTLDGDMHIDERRREVFSASGRVTASIEIEGKMFRSEVQLVQFSRDLWRLFLESSRLKQGRADNILQSIRRE